MKSSKKIISLISLILFLLRNLRSGLFILVRRQGPRFYSIDIYEENKTGNKTHLIRYTFRCGARWLFSDEHEIYSIPQELLSTPGTSYRSVYLVASIIVSHANCGYSSMLAIDKYRFLVKS